MAIYVIRHGETRGNAERVVQTPEVPLSPRGLQQARRLAKRLAAVDIERILTSDLARASMTADRLRASTAAPLELEPLLQERNFGEVRGVPYAELDVDIFAPGYAPPGGETWETFHQRVDRAWLRVREIAEETTGHLAVVTHGLVCFSLATRHWSLAAEGEPQAGFANTSLTIVDAALPHRVAVFNCTAHLDTGDDRRSAPA